MSTKKEALVLLIAYLRQQGIEGTILIRKCRPCENFLGRTRYQFILDYPEGIYFVNPDGSVHKK